MQFPLVLPWVYTIYKAQGLSLHCGAISFSLQRQKSFNQGQMYVALSRIRSLENIYLIRKNTPGAIIKTKQLRKNMKDKERKICLPHYLFFRLKNTVTLSLLNVRYLNRHVVIGIMSDKYLRENNILCLTETQILPNDNTYSIEAAFQSQFFYQFTAVKIIST